MIYVYVSNQNTLYCINDNDVVAVDLVLVLVVVIRVAVVVITVVLAVVIVVEKKTCRIWGNPWGHYMTYLFLMMMIVVVVGVGLVEAVVDVVVQCSCTM